MAAARRRAESELDVPSDEEIDGRLVRSETPPAAVSPMAAVPTPVLPHPTPATSHTSKEALSIIKNPALAASTASYLDSLILRLGSANQPLPPTTAAAPAYATTTSGTIAPAYEQFAPMGTLPHVSETSLQPMLGALPSFQPQVESTWTTTQPVRPPSGWISSIPQH